MVPRLTFFMSLCVAVLLASYLHLPAQSQTAPDVPDEVSSGAAASLSRKISRVLAAEHLPGRSPSAESLVVSDEELESFVIYSMKDEIRPRVDSIDVGLEAGVIWAAADLVLDSGLESGNPLIDMLAQGSHSLFLKGAFEAKDGVGKFELQEVRVDGVPVPIFFVDALIAQYVTPEHPQVDIDAPFRVPWGIESISLSTGTATIRY